MSLFSFTNYFVYTTISKSARSFMNEHDSSRADISCPKMNPPIVFSIAKVRIYRLNFPCMIISLIWPLLHRHTHILLTRYEQGYENSYCRISNCLSNSYSYRLLILIEKFGDQAEHDYLYSSRGPWRWLMRYWSLSRWGRWPVLCSHLRYLVVALSRSLSRKNPREGLNCFFIVLNAISNHNIRYDHVLCFMRAPKTLSCSDFLMDCGYRNSQKKRQKWTFTKLTDIIIRY